MKTTKKDFELFKQCCQEWQNKLGIKDWSIHYDHADADEAYARTFWKTSERIATIVFGTVWDDMRKKTDEEINRLALHECLHIVMAPLGSEAMARFTTQDAIDTAEHSIIRQLENLF